MYRKKSDSFLIRFGVWNYLEISLYKEEFTNNNSNYELFVNLLKLLLSGDEVSIDKFDNDRYSIDVLNKLEDLGIIKLVDDNVNKSIDNITLIINDDSYNNIFPDDFLSERQSDVISISQMDKYLDDGLLNRHDELSFQKDLSEYRKYFSKYSQLIVIMTSVNLNLLKKLNVVMTLMDKSWTLGYIDGFFVNICSFNTEYTGCFECLNSQESIRVENYNNYLSYIKNEKQFEKNTKIKNSTYRLLVSNIESIESSKYTECNSPLEGKIISIYLPTYEIQVENLYRSPICPICGASAVNVSEQYNISTQNSINELLGDYKNDYRK